MDRSDLTVLPGADSSLRPILSFFPEGETPTNDQRELLLAYERLPEKVQLVCINMPVAAGKTFMLDTIAAYEAARLGGSTIVLPTNHLAGQMWDDIGKRGYSRAPYKSGAGNWDAVKETWKSAPLKLANNYSYLALRGYSPCVLFDEAHKLTDFLREMEGVKLWAHLTPWPQNLYTIEQFLYWVHGLELDGDRYDKLKKILKKDVSQFVMERTTEIYGGPTRGVERECLKLLPLTPRQNKPILWPPSRVKRLVFASATLSHEDLYDLGSDRRYTAWLLAESRIPKSQRPVIYEPWASPTFGQEGEVERLANGILHIAERHPDTKGLVHVSYNLARNLRPFLKGRRFIFHSKESKNSAFNQWQATENGVLLACGMHEGIDLKYDKARWQCIAKVMWPSRADHAVLQKAEQRPEWYVWEAVKILLQSYGRVCRMPDDYGVTYIITSEFERLYKEGVRLKLWPKWFLEALR